MPQPNNSKGKSPLASLTGPDRIIVFALGFCFAVITVYFLLQPLWGNALKYDFSSPATMKQWKVSGNHLLSPSLPADEKGVMNWDDYPYIKLSVNRGEKERNGALVWYPQKDLNINHSFIFTIPAGRDQIILSVKKEEFWIRRSAWSGAIIRFGFYLNPDVHVRTVALKSTLSFPERIRVFLDEFFTVEPLLPYSINGLYGNTVFRVPVVLCFGVGFLIVAAYYFFRPNTFSRLVFIGSAVAAFVAIDMQWNHTFWQEVRYSSERSAWHYDRFDEYESRFGDSFGKLAREFEERVPAGANVFFSKEREFRVRGEENWIAFQYYPRYKSVSLDKADWIFYFEPKDVKYNAATKQVVSNDGQSRSDTLKTAYSFTEDAQIFEVMRD
ncbi:MAG: hypothetical protein Q8R76_11685 [Candidatus Omnitrophota bacterium]|nr:hypothetical protein [Candidatus Omnitrophota bacterium]